MSSYRVGGLVFSDELYHFRTKGSKNGVRRYQYPDGSLTPEGREHYGVGPPREEKQQEEKKGLVSRVVDRLRPEKNDRPADMKHRSARDVRSMSTEELKQWVERSRLEKEYYENIQKLPESFLRRNAQKLVDTLMTKTIPELVKKAAEQQIKNQNPQNPKPQNPDNQKPDNQKPKNQQNGDPNIERGSGQIQEVDGRIVSTNSNDIRRNERWSDRFPRRQSPREELRRDNESGGEQSGQDESNTRDSRRQDTRNLLDRRRRETEQREEAEHRRQEQQEETERRLREQREEVERRRQEQQEARERAEARYNRYRRNGMMSFDAMEREWDRVISDGHSNSSEAREFITLNGGQVIPIDLQENDVAYDRIVRESNDRRRK